MKKKVLILASLVIAMTATTVKAQLNVGATTAPITTLDVQGNAYITTNLGVGTSTPHAPLQLGNATANRKMVLFETANNDNQFYGFGLQSGILRYQVDNVGASHVFYAATSSGTSSELMRIGGNGNVGIGISAPAAKLHIAADNGYNGGQFAIGGLSNTNQQLQLGYNTSSNQGFLQATVVGSTYNNLVLNPGGGFVGIGIAVPSRPLDVNAGSSPVRFTSLASTTSTTNVLAIDASGDIRSIPVTSLATTAPSGGPQITTAGGYAMTGNEGIIFSAGNIVLAAPTAAQIGHSITILASGGNTVVLNGSTPYRSAGGAVQSTVPVAYRITITGVNSSHFAGGANCWVVTAKDF